MGRQSRTKQSANRRERIAAQRAAEHRRQVRNRVLISSGAVIVVLAIVAVFIVIKANSKPGTAPNGPTGAALASVVKDTTNVPASTLTQVGAGSVDHPPFSISAPRLTSGGKPEVLYIGAEYCPYCAFERWGMIVALSRFGTFSGLSTVHSSSSDVYPNSPTWTFYKSTYTSRYVTFTPVEETTNVPDSGSQLGYKLLQTPTSAQEAIIEKYNAPPYVPTENKGSIPFVDIGGSYLISGSSDNSGSPAIHGKSWATIAAALKDPSTAEAKAIDGTANYLTAGICKLTGDQPSSVCTSPVTALQSKMVPASGS